MSFITGTQAELLYSMPATGVSVTGTNSTTSADLITPQNSSNAPPYQLPAYFFPNTYGVGKSLLIQGGGTVLSGPATQNVAFALFANTTAGTALTLLARTGLFQPLPTTGATGAFMFEILLTGTTVGTSTTLNTVGVLNTGTVLTVATSSTATVPSAGTSIMMGSATQPVINNATAYFIEMFAYFGATTTTQAVTLTNMTVWGLN